MHKSSTTMKCKICSKINVKNWRLCAMAFVWISIFPFISFLCNVMHDQRSRTYRLSCTYLYLKKLWTEEIICYGDSEKRTYSYSFGTKDDGRPLFVTFSMPLLICYITVINEYLTHLQRTKLFWETCQTFIVMCCFVFCST